MKKFVLITLFLLSSLSARENPFSAQTMVETPKLILPKLTIQKPIKVEVIKKEEPKKLPMKIPELKVVKTTPIVVKKTVIKPKKRKIKKLVKKSKSQLIYNGKFIKIRLISSGIKITTKDHMLQNLKLKHPNRLIVDFERFDVVGPFSKKVYSKKIKSLKIGHHDYFYRTIFKLAKDYRYKIIKKPYGYFIKL